MQICDIRKICDTVVPPPLIRGFWDERKNVKNRVTGGDRVTEGMLKPYLGMVNWQPCPV